MDEAQRASVQKLRDVARIVLLLVVLGWTWLPSVVVAFWCLFISLPIKYLHTTVNALQNLVLDRDVSQRTALVTGAHRPEGLHMARILKKEGFHVVAVTPRCFLTTLSFYSICVDRLIQVPCPRVHSQRYIRHMLRIAVDYDVDIFVPVSGPKEAETEARLAHSLTRLGVTCFAAPLQHLDYFVRLDRFYELVESLNMETVMYYTAHDMERIVGLYRRGVIVINGCRFMAKMAAPNGLHESKWLPMPRDLAEAQRKYNSVIHGGPWVVAKFTSGFQYVLTVLVKKNRVLACLVCREGQILRMVRCREMEQWAFTFFRRLSFDVSGAFTIRFLKTVPEGRRTTFLPVFCKPCPHLSILFLDGHMGLMTELTSEEHAPAQVQELALDIVNHPDRPLCVYSIYQQLMELLLLCLQARPRRLVTELVHTLRLVMRGREVVFRLCDPLPGLLWYFVLLPWRICMGILVHGSTCGQLQFLNGRLRHSHYWSECFADEPGRSDDDLF